jgi:tetratricopeptide (TPR) repeat protein
MSTWEQAFERGMQAGERADLVAAEQAFREAVALAPSEPYPHYELGYTLCLAGKLVEALTELRRAQQLHRGFFLVETEIYLCEKLLSRAIDVETFAALRNLMLLTDSGQGTTLQAEQLCRSAVDRSPECALGHFFLGKAILERLPDQAKAAFERCVELYPDDTTLINARFHLGVLRRLAGAPDEARAIWQRIARDFADHPHAQLARMQAAG